MYERTHCLACKTKKTHARPTQVRRNHPALPAQWCYGCSVISPANQLFCHRPPGLLSPRVVPCIGGTGPHGLTVRLGAHRLHASASIATRLTSGDEWPSRPPCRGGLVSLNHNFCLSERQIFLRGALDTSGKTGGGFLVSCASSRASNTSVSAVPRGRKMARSLHCKVRAADSR